MNINDIIKRIPKPPPWSHGDPIPWNSPEFSAAVLKNHLSQDHDWASRREGLIEHHINYIDSQLARGSRILDLACGPGFYTQKLARLGHTCLGVDFSPASIEYAREQAASADLTTATYELNDIRQFAPSESYDCVLFVFGEFNVFSENEAVSLLSKVSESLKPGGLFVLEGQSFKSIKKNGLTPNSWWTCDQDEGILSPKPNLCLQENFWHEDLNTATTRYYTLDGATGETKMFCSSMTGYSTGRYENMLTEAGFKYFQILQKKQWPVGASFEGVMMTMVCRKG